METLFIAATAIAVFIFSAVAVVLWKFTAFLKVGFFDFRFVLMILLAVAAKYLFDRIKVVLKEHT